MACQQGKYTEPQRNLLRSVIKGDKSRVEELLKEFEWNPEELGNILLHAVRLGTIEAAHMLLEAGADVSTYNQDEYINFLAGLARLVRKDNPGHRDFALLVMEHVADLNVRGQMALSLLQEAINECSITVEIIERLVAPYRATMSKTVIECYISSGTRADVIEKLVNLEVRVNTDSYSTLFNRPDAATIVPLLLQRNLFDDEAGNARAAKALCCCVQYAKKEQALLYTKMILDMQFSARDLDTCFTLTIAVQRGHLEIVQLLLDYGFDVNKRGKDDLLPLYIAAELQQSTIAELLIEAGAQINADFAKEFAIHNACRNASADNIQVLLQHRAIIDLNRLGYTTFSPIPRIFQNERMTRMHRAVVEHLAVMVSKDKRVCHENLTIIQRNDEMRSHYDQCINELEMMKTCKIVNDIPFSSIFREDIRELLFATRKCDLIENRMMCENNFPIFHEEMDLSFKRAKKQKELLRDKEEAFHESLEKFLPDIPMQKIICYLYFNNIDN